MTALNTPDQIALAHLAQTIACLKIEVATGLKHSKGSVLRMAQEVYGVKSRTKAGALSELRATYEEATGRAY